MDFDKEKEQLVLALDLARIGFYDWNVVENHIVYNKHMLDDWGIVDGSSMTLQDAINHIHPDDQERVNQLVNEALEKRTPYSTEYRVVRPDGSIVWMDVNGLVQFDELDRPIRFFGTSLNITEKKKKALILEESEAMIRSFADSMPQMAFIADATGAITYFNKPWYDYVSSEGTEGWGWKAKPIHHPDDLDRTIERWTHSIRTGDPYEIDYRLRRHDGEYRWHLGRALPHRDQNGKITHWYGTNTDIHDERTALERNRILHDFAIAMSKGLSPNEIAEAILKKGARILNNNAGVVLFTHGDSFWVAASSNMPTEYFTNSLYLDEKVRLPAKAALLEKKSFFLGNKEDFIKEFPAYHSTLKKMNSKGVVAIPIKVQGNVIASAAYFLKEETVFTDEIKLFFESISSQAAIALDRAMMFEKQCFQTEELEAALKARDEFFSIASHELKTPLTSMRLSGQYIIKKLQKGPEGLTPDIIMGFAQHTDKGVSKLVRLVDDMLDISRIRTGTMTLRKENFDICELADDIIHRSRANNDTEVILDLCQAPSGNWDKLRIEQVFSNLMSNAIRYGNKKPVHVKVKSAGENIHISVQDHGIGIPHDILNSIFDRYERGPSGDIQGLGLGLYISKQIVESHGGKIWAESTIGQGSTFFVELPINQ